jgi:hypothetical protein
MKSADWVDVGYQIDNNNRLLYNYKHVDLITPRVKAISSSSADRKNTGCGAVLSFAGPAPAQDFRQSPTSSADNFLQKQQKQRGGLWRRRRRDALPAPPGPLARGMARQQHRRTGTAIRCCARGRTARCRAGDRDKSLRQIRWQRMKPDQPAAALVSCTVTLGAAKRISLAAKASINRRNAWRCR